MSRFRNVSWPRFSGSNQVFALLALTVAGMGRLAAQSVTNLDIFKGQYYTQTSSAAPTSADFYTFNARVFVDAVISDASFSVTSTAAPGGPYGGVHLTDSVFQHYENFYDQTLFNAAYGPGVYNFSLQSDDLLVPSQTGALTLAADHYASATPYFTNFAAMQSIDAGQDFTFHWNSFVPTGGTSQITLSFYDHTVGGSPLDVNPGASATSYDLVSGSLIAGHEYGVVLYFNSFDSQLGAWTPTADGIVSFDQITTVTITAIPEPAATGAVAALGTLALAAFARRRRAV